MTPTPFDRLVAVRPAVVAYLVAITGDPHLAEDVAQELSLLIARKPDEVPAGEAFHGWIRTAARLQALNHLRRERRAGRRFAPSTAELVDSAWREAEEDPAHAEAERRALRRCLERLAAPVRRMMELRFTERLAVEAVADAIGKSVPAVYKALARAQRFLADCVQQRLREEPHGG